MKYPRVHVLTTLKEFKLQLKKRIFHQQKGMLARR